MNIGLHVGWIYKVLYIYLSKYTYSSLRGRDPNLAKHFSDVVYSRNVNNQLHEFAATIVYILYADSRNQRKDLGFKTHTGIGVLFATKNNVPMNGLLVWNQQVITKFRNQLV